MNNKTKIVSPGCFLILEIFRKIPTSGSKFFPWKKVGFQPQNMPQLAFPESVRAVVGSLCRNGQVLGVGQNECKEKGTR